MMRKLVLVAVAALVVPASVSAQSVGIAARAGSLGLGGEVAIGLSERFQIRGGAGVIPIEFEGTYSEVDYTIQPTTPMANVGADLFLAGGLRVGGGLLFLQNETEMTAVYTGDVEIGNRTYNGEQLGQLNGFLNHGSVAPYAVLGFGRGAGSGFGMFVDLGAAFLKEAALRLESTGPVSGNAEFQAELERERATAEEEAKDYLKILPIVSIGIRFGIM